MKKVFLILGFIALLLTSCVNENEQFEILRKKYPHSSIYVDEDEYIVVDTTGRNCVMFKIMFLPNSTKIVSTKCIR